MTPQSCPSSTHLLDLLSAAQADPAGGLQTHIAGCSACAAELQTLRQAFSALGPASGSAAAVPMDAQLLPRVQARLLTVAAAEARARSFTYGALASLSIVVSLGGWVLLRGHPLISPPSVALAAMPLAMAGVLGAARAVQRGVLILALLAVSAFLLASTSDQWVPFTRGVGCLSLWLTGVVGPALILRSVARSQGGGALSGALIGVALFSGGATLQRALCNLGGLAHIGGFHLLPWLLGVAALALFSASVRPSRTVGPTEQTA